jgi:hypothetical protein
MYVLRGNDATKLLFDTSFKGWGGEDGDFVSRIKELRHIYRRTEPGLIHMWHLKTCRMGIEVKNNKQFESCRASGQRHEGSELGQELLATSGKAKLSSI